MNLNAATPKTHETAAQMAAGTWQLNRPLTAAETETQAILADWETMKALAQAENEMVLAAFRLAIIQIAAEAAIWEGQPGLDELVLARTQEAMEQALRDRANIRMKYKVSLL